MSEPMNAAVIGMGKMGLVHASTVKTDPRLRVTAFCDTSKFMLQALGKFLPDVTMYDDYEKMLRDEALDVVYVATPTSAHSAIASTCARAGKHVFVEKPLGTTLAEAQDVADAVSAAGVRSQVGYVCRYAPTFERAREIVRSGALGRILGFGSVKYSSDVQKRVEKSWRFMGKAKSGGGGGVINEFACHGVDLLVWMFGEPRGVHAHKESWYSEEVEDTVHAVFNYDDFSGWFDSSWSMQDFRKPYNRIEVTGENGKLSVTDSELRWMLQASHAGHDAGWHALNVTDLYQPVDMFVGDIMFSRQADDFLKSVAGGEPSRSPADSALATQRVLEAMHGGASR